VNVVWSNRALKSLAEIHNHISKESDDISKESDDAANRTVDGVLKRLISLQIFHASAGLSTGTNDQASVSLSSRPTALSIECAAKPWRLSTSFTQRSCHLGNVEVRLFEPGSQVIAGEFGKVRNRRCGDGDIPVGVNQSSDFVPPSLVRYTT